MQSLSSLFYVCLGQSDVAIDCTPAGYRNDEHDQAVILDRVHHTVAPDTDTPQVGVAFQVLRTQWAGIIYQCGNRGQDARGDLSIQSFEILESRRTPGQGGARGHRVCASG